VKLFISFLLLTVSAAAQQPLVLIDPARGGSQGGSHIADRVEEKQVTLQVAQRMANLLRARGFAVQLTRDADTDTTNDQRAAVANTTHPIACILLSASSTGNGVHLFTTTLPQPATVDPAAPVQWDQAQAAYAARSHALASGMKEAFGRTRLPIATGTTWTRPLDNMQCPAVAIEMGPLQDGTAADDPPYQSRVADTIAGVLLFWRNKVASMMPPAPPKPETPPPVAPSATAKPTGVAQ
jgi:N-acetylmuramoyl-L-alanine amidase